MTSKTLSGGYLFVYLYFKDQILCNYKVYIGSTDLDLSKNNMNFNLTQITKMWYKAFMTNNAHREFRVRKIPEELYKQFKIAAVLKGLSVNELFLEAMKQVVTKNRGKS